jgi:phosphoribosyl-AMP cyclohydrolase
MKKGIFPIDSEPLISYMDAEALRRTQERGEVVMYSLARDSYMAQGTDNGNAILVTKIYADEIRGALFITAREAIRLDAETEQ